VSSAREPPEPQIIDVAFAADETIVPSVILYCLPLGQHGRHHNPSMSCQLLLPSMRRTSCKPQQHREI
jgi:hypothetical protein